MFLVYFRFAYCLSESLSELAQVERGLMVFLFENYVRHISENDYSKIH